MRVRTALAKSKNLVSVRVLQAIGPQYAQDYIARFGFDPKLHPPYLTMALGAGSATPLQMVAPTRCSPTAATASRRTSSPRSSTPAATCCPRPRPPSPGESAERAIDPRNAFIMTTLLQDVDRVGTAARALALGRTDLAGKTGTTNENVDAWFCGFNAAMVGVAWIGFDQPKTLGTNETGGVAALPIWIAYMAKVLKGVAGSQLADARRRRRGARSTPTRACATTRAASPSTSSPNSRRAGATTAWRPPASAGQGHPRPAVLTCRRRASRRRCATARPRAARRDAARAHDRARIAQVAARLIAEHGLTDWSLAKRKAARQLMLPESAPLPSNDEIEVALHELSRALRRRRARRAACARSATRRSRWMQRLAAWDPLLVGGVAAGWATAHSDVRLELVADDAKAVEIALASDGVALRGAAAARDDDARRAPA